MKKLIVTVFVILMLTSLGSAQELGVRFGDIVGNTVAIDGMYKQFHGDVSFGGDGVGLEVLYDFYRKPLKGEAFGVYAGAGALTWLGDPFLLGISGEIGLDYHFNNLPLSLSFDWRPSFTIIENTDFNAGRFGFNVRFVF